jgi:hypothetical protein
MFEEKFYRQCPLPIAKSGYEVHKVLNRFNSRDVQQYDSMETSTLSLLDVNHALRNCPCPLVGLEGHRPRKC